MGTILLIISDTHIDTVLVVEIRRAETRVQLVAHFLQPPHARQQLSLVLKNVRITNRNRAGRSGTHLVAANRQQNRLLRYAEAGAHHGLQVRLVPILPETRHLSGRRHLDAEHEVGAGQARERELRHLDAHPSAAAEDVDPLDVLADDDSRRHGDKVVVQRLGDEWKGAGDSDVAFDHLQVVVLAD